MVAEQVICINVWVYHYDGSGAIMVGEKTWYPLLKSRET